MTTETTIVIIVLALAMVGLAAWVLMRTQRSEHLQRRFGPEYDRAVQEHGDRQHAEVALEKREKRLARFEIRPLSPSDHDRFVKAWRTVQARFVDDPPDPSQQSPVVFAVKSRRGSGSIRSLVTCPRTHRASLAGAGRVSRGQRN